MKAKWPRPALVQNAAPRSDQIHPIGPSGVSRLDAVVEAIDYGWKLDSQFPHTGACNRISLRFIFRTGEEHAVVDIGLHRPDVRGMCFKDVDRVERNLILILLSQLVQGGNLPPEGRSGIAPEDQNHRLRSPQRGKLDRRPGFEGADGEIRSRVAWVEVAAAGLVPQGSERQEKIRGHGHVSHHAAEFLGW